MPVFNAVVTCKFGSKTSAGMLSATTPPADKTYTAIAESRPFAKRFILLPHLGRMLSCFYRPAGDNVGVRTARRCGVQALFQRRHLMSSARHALLSVTSV